MIHNLSEYFLPQQEFYLDNIVYNRLEKNSENLEYSLNCIDTIHTSLEENGIKIIITRILKFEPEEIFEVSVSFGAFLTFNPHKKDDYNWYELNLSEEFRENGEFVVSNLMHRISLLISQITSSFGQTPIILPPHLASKPSTS